MRTRLISSAPQRFILERRRKRVLLSMLAQMQYGDSLDTIVSTSKWPKSALSLASWSLLQMGILPCIWGLLLRQELRFFLFLPPRASQSISSRVFLRKSIGRWLHGWSRSCLVSYRAFLIWFAGSISVWASIRRSNKAAVFWALPWNEVCFPFALRVCGLTMPGRMSQICAFELPCWSYWAICWVGRLSVFGPSPVPSTGIFLPSGLTIIGCTWVDGVCYLFSRVGVLIF